MEKRPVWARHAPGSRPRKFYKKNTRSPFVGLVEDVVCHILDVVGAEALAEGRHGALAVGHLGFDGIDIVTAGEVLLKRLLSEFFLGHHAVVATGVAGCAVAKEDALAVLKVRCQSRAAPNGGCQQPHSDAQCQWVPCALRG